MAVEQLAREAQGAHRVLGTVAAGRVGQDRVAAGGNASSNEGSFAFWPILVRRIATVTISAPLASTARRVSSKSRYLPVPIKRRER
jgi:hypothetical protein